MSIFSIQATDLNSLDDSRAVELFRKLLLIEASKLRIPFPNLQISLRTTVADGGIDATTDNPLSGTASDFIQIGFNAFQIKSGTSFTPWQDACIKDELFRRSNPEDKDHLKSQTRSCLDRNGRYVLVCFGNDFTSQEHSGAVQLLIDKLKLCGYSNPKVEVWGHTQLVAILEKFPALCLDLKGIGGRFHTYVSWSIVEGVGANFESGAPQTQFIESIREKLRSNTEAIHIRVTGEPGIGKTKAVYEALGADDLRPLVVYYPAAELFRDSDLMYRIIHNQIEVIVVVDECNFSDTTYIWNQLRNKGKDLKLITITHEPENSPGFDYLNVQALEKQLIANIIMSYGFRRDQIERLAEMCGGYPRFAHQIGINLQRNPQNIFNSVGHANVWGAIIAGDDDLNSSEVKERHEVLKYLALFSKFGFQGPVANEARIIAQKIQNDHPLITWAKFTKIVSDLKRMKILQGEYSLYITPKILHIKLWYEWWESYGGSFNLSEFLKGLTPELKEWFIEMFSYGGASPEVLAVAEQLLGPQGMFNDG